VMDADASGGGKGAILIFAGIRLPPVAAFVVLSGCALPPLLSAGLELPSPCRCCIVCASTAAALLYPDASLLRWGCLCSAL
jgi:hypothetical protein